jgi:ATP synthase F1 complex assembly factor 1
VYKDKIAAVRKDAAIPSEVDAVLNATVTPSPSPSPTPAPLTQPPPSAPTPIATAARKAATPPGVKTLASFVDPEKLSAHNNPREIELIWRARFVNDATSLCASVPANTYKRMSVLAKKHPMFLLPLPRDGQGVELHLLQWTFPTKESATVIFTTLADYKLRGEFAQPHTTLTHHLELAESHGVVLAQGQVVPERGVTVEQAQLLVVALQKFYGAIEGPQAVRRREMLEQFTRGDEGFSVEALIEEMEKTV